MSETPSGESPDRERRLVLGLAVAASVALVVALCWVRYLPTQDGPQHVFLGRLENHFADPDQHYADYMQQGHPVTSLGFAIVFSALDRLMPWHIALRATLSLILLCWAWSFMAFVSAIDPRRIALGLVGFAVALQWGLYMGFFSYVFSTGLGFAVLALAVRHDPWTWRHRVLIAALLLLEGVVHLFGAQVVALVLIAIVAVRARGPSRLRELAALGAMLLPIAGLAALTVEPGMEGKVEWIPWVDRVGLLARAFASGPVWRAWSVLGLGLYGLASAASRVWHRRRLKGDVPIGLACLALFVLALVLPLHVAGWEFLSPRFIPVATMLGVSLVPLETFEAKLRRAVTAGLAAFAAVSIAWAGHYNGVLARKMGDALSGLDLPIRRSGPRLVVVLDPYGGLTTEPIRGLIPFQAPLFQIGALYNSVQGGIPWWVFSSRPTIHAFVFTQEGRDRYPLVPDPVTLADPRWTSDPLARNAMVTWLAALGTRFTDIIFSGQPRDTDVFVARGYEPDWRQGGLLIARFVGCPVDIEIAASAPFEEPVIAEYGADPDPKSTNDFLVPAGAAPKDGKITITPRACLCGDVWYRVALDLDRSDSPTPRDRYCAGADGEGRVHLRATPGKHTLRCQLQ